MKKIRESVFETNSSSSHSFTIVGKTNKIYDTIWPDSNAQIILTGGEFGWGPETFNDPETKANYCAVYLSELKNQEFTNRFIKTVKDHTGAKDVLINLSESAFIDHQSSPTETNSFSEVFQSEQTVKDFAFNSESLLIIDNDNYGYYDYDYNDGDD